MRTTILAVIAVLAAGCGAPPVAEGEACVIGEGSTCGPASVRYDCVDGRWHASRCIACHQDATKLLCSPLASDGG